MGINVKTNDSNKLIFPQENLVKCQACRDTISWLDVGMLKIMRIKNALSILASGHSY
jgi:hypothetical protein